MTDGIQGVKRMTFSDKLSTETEQRLFSALWNEKPRRRDWSKLWAWIAVGCVLAAFIAVAYANVDTSWALDRFACKGGWCE